MGIISFFNVFITAPWLIIAPLVVAVLLRMRRKTKPTTVAVVLWALYLIWEFTLWSGLGGQEGDNIRVDLLLIAPLLIAATLLAIWSAFRNQPDTESGT